MTPEMLIPEAIRSLAGGAGAGLGFYLFLRLTGRQMPRGRLLPSLAVGVIAAVLAFGLGLFSTEVPT